MFFKTLKQVKTFPGQGGHRVWGTEGGPGLEPRWSLGSQIYRQFAAVKCFSTQVCCRLCPPSPLPTQKLLRICTNPMTQHGRGRVDMCSPMPTHGYATEHFITESNSMVSANAKIISCLLQSAEWQQSTHTSQH